MRQNTVQEAVAFGVGCFHFGLKKSPPFTLGGSEYLRELRNQVEAIPSVDHISIDSYLGFEDASMELDEPLTSVSSGARFFPPPASGLEIGFEIYIPYRIQSQLIPFCRKPLTGTETFKVHIRNPYYFPITFVEAIAPAGDCEPSDGVAVVREFLKKHFKQPKSDGIEFDCLGPSPFHADFFLRPGSISQEKYDSNGFCCEPAYRRGYDQMDFFFDPGRFETMDLAKESLFRELEEEIGVFYRLIHLDVMRTRQWEQLQDLVNHLVSLHEMRGPTGLLNRVVKAHRQIQELVIAIAVFERDELWVDGVTHRSYRSLTRSGIEPYIDSHLKATVSSRPAYKCRQIQDLIQLLEGRRSKVLEQAIVVLSAIIGGVVGAVITLLVAP